MVSLPAFSRSAMTAAGFALALLMGAAGATPANAQDTTPTVPRADWPAPVHALALYGDVKYPTDFTHFEYTNPEAPKGGDLRLFGFGNFDTLNPFTIKGVTAAGAALPFETLTTASLDEPFTHYGLLAESIVLAEDRSWIAYNLRPEARFHDGTPITAEDVKFSFDILKSDGPPLYRLYYKSVVDPVVIDERTIQFTLLEPDNRELALIIGQLPVLSKSYWDGKEFGDTTLEPPVGSGPYKVKDLEPGRFISYERVADYWGADLAVRTGMFNFDEIRYEYYRDHLIAVEAFKAGEYDYRTEHISKVWAADYNIDAVKDGRIVKEEIHHERPQGMQAFVYNLRRPLFADPRVREALAYGLNFEWTNQNIFYSQYKRSRSFFNNSIMDAIGVPEGDELALLEPFRDQLPERLFTEEYTPPKYEQIDNVRPGLAKALQLFAEAGWTVQDGALRNEAGEPFTFEIIIVQPEFDRIILPMVQNWERMGVTATIRAVDTSQYINRLNAHDFDMVVTSWAQSESPGNEQREMWTSLSADSAGSRNLAGLKNPVVDALVDQLLSAQSREELELRVRALDRVLQWQFLVIPQWYTDYDRVIHWDRFGRPEIMPSSGVSVMTWWTDEERASRLTGRQAR